MSENVKHTPGPWGAEGKQVLVRGLTFLSHAHFETPEGEANTRLIAAAPDMLAALKAAVQCGIVPVSTAADGGANKHSNQVRVADMIRAAIAKAEGQS